MALGQDEFDYLKEETEENSENEKISDDAKPQIKIKHKTKPELEKPEKPEDKKEIELKEPKKPDEQSSNENSQIFVVKVTTNKEDRALDIVAEKIKKKQINVYALARPHGLRGYIFLEAPDRENAEEAVFNLPYVKGIIPKTISYDEIKSMLEPITADIKIEKNDIVEIISEPFKKEKAKVIRIDKAKEEAVVSLLGAAVPIPVTVKLDNLRVIRREDEEIED